MANRTQKRGERASTGSIPMLAFSPRWPRFADLGATLSRVLRADLGATLSRVLHAYLGATLSRGRAEPRRAIAPGVGGLDGPDEGGS